MELRLSDLQPAQEGRLLDLGTDGLISLRLRQFGIISGTSVRCIGRSLGGSPLLFRAKGIVLALRKRDCDKLSVELLP